MRILLHTCCGPCLVYPVRDLASQAHEVTAFYFNPNIHPYSEYLRRLEALRICAQAKNVPLLEEEDEDGMESWLRQVVLHETQRCRICFNIRLQRTAIRAAEIGFDAFSTTLLYSHYQNHDLLRTVAEAISETRGVPFFYKDWRTGWDEGVREYRELGLYRQKYCGCIYSEKERTAEKKR